MLFTLSSLTCVFGSVYFTSNVVTLLPILNEFFKNIVYAGGGTCVRGVRSQGKTQIISFSNKHRLSAELSLWLTDTSLIQLTRIQSEGLG